MAKSYTLYVLECENGAFYTGYTTDMVRRYKEHQSGSPKCKYTRSFPPVRLCATWVFHCERSQIFSLERQLKALTHAQKAQLIEQPDQLRYWLPNYAETLSDSVS